MKLTRFIVFPVLLTLFTAAYAQDGCSTYNKQATAVEFTPNGDQGHVTGNHNWSVSLGGSCSYTGNTQGQICSTLCLTTVGAWLESETGTITPVLYSHELGETQNLGQTSAPNGGAVQCQSTAAVAANSCILSCAVSISITAGPGGAGATISYPPQAIFTQSDPYTVSCLQESLPVQLPPPVTGCGATNANQTAPCGNPEPDCPDGDGGTDPCCYCPGSGANPSLPLCGDCGSATSLLTDPDQIFTRTSCGRKLSTHSIFPVTLER